MEIKYKDEGHEQARYLFPSRLSSIGLRAEGTMTISDEPGGGLLVSKEKHCTQVPLSWQEKESVTSSRRRDGFDV